MTEADNILKLFEKLVNSDLHDIPKDGQVEICSDQGVYIIYDAKEVVLHVGKTNGGKNGINQRLLNHIRNQSSFSKLFMKPNSIVLRNGGKFKFIVIASARERSLLESLTAGMLCPAHLGTGEKTKNRAVI